MSNPSLDSVQTAHWNVLKITGDQGSATLASLIGSGSRVLGLLMAAYTSKTLTVNFILDGNSFFDHITGSGLTETLWFTSGGIVAEDAATTVAGIPRFPPSNIPAQVNLGGTITDITMTVVNESAANGETYIFYVGGKPPVVM